MGKADKAIAKAQNAKDFKHANPGWCRVPTIARILCPFPANSMFSFCRQGRCAETTSSCATLPTLVFPEILQLASAAADGHWFAEEISSRLLHCQIRECVYQGL